MFSYRHAFHAGNHADVLKHITLIATLKHLMLKEPAITLVDTHAGAGLYRLDSDYANKAGEAADGIVKIILKSRPDTGEAIASTVALGDYLDVIAKFNPKGTLRVYPGSPVVMQTFMRNTSRDRLKLLELHPTDNRTLNAHMAQLEAGRQIAVMLQDGFEGLRGLLPPPPSANGSRRALVLIDPSYEIKSDYARVNACVQDSISRFPTGCYLVWYPIIARAEAHDLPRRLKALCAQAGRPWLHATLNIGHKPLDVGMRQGMTASGMFVINPTHTLQTELQTTLPVLVKLLGRGRGQGHTVEIGNA